ncbi:hypothetical protein [Nocardia amamiensis]|uniref:hypothetical protein n=1 Tax=Nocardia amamiensis TaxID=404578 RepID=UPI0008326C70|nr:hypothetical protein [Nocardia amamiensis]
MAAEDTGTRRWLAPIGLGALCVGCCVVPLLIAAGVLGGGLALVSLSWLQPVGIALVAVGMVGLLWARARARRTGCTATGTSRDCAGSGCRCTTVTAP